MYDAKDENLVIVIVSALFLLPVLIIIFRRNIFKQFSFALLIKTLNIAFLIQLILGIVLFIAATIVDKRIGENFQLNRSTEIFMGVDYTFSVIGIMIYLPALVVLNIIKWISSKFNGAR